MEFHQEDKSFSISRNLMMQPHKTHNTALGTDLELRAGLEG